MSRVKQWLQERAEQVRSGAKAAEPLVPHATVENPSEIEVLKRKVTHASETEWCETCMLARSRMRDHSRATGEEGGPPRLQFDFCYLRADGAQEDGGLSGRSEQPLSTTIMGVGESTQAPFALAPPTKSPSDESVSSAVVVLVRR